METYKKIQEDFSSAIDEIASINLKKTLSDKKETAKVVRLLNEMFIAYAANGRFCDYDQDGRQREGNYVIEIVEMLERINFGLTPWKENN